MNRRMDTKPGNAAADRVREKFAAAREKRQEALDKAFDPDRDFEPAATSPTIVLKKSDYPTQGFRMPKKIKPYIIGGILALALTGAGVQPEFLVSFAKSLLGMP